MRDMRTLAALLCLFSGSAGNISLYSDTEEVVDLLDSNTSLLYNSDSLWLVQFYSHWCGHCQRFAPTWKDLARSIAGWAPVVRIAAMNCAEQSCDKYQISSTPTIRVFHPLTASNQLSPAFYGYTIPVQSSKEYYQDTAIYNIASAANNGVAFPVNLNFLRTAPNPDKKVLSAMFDTLPATAEHVALIFEQEGQASVGKKVILDTNKQSKLLPTFRLNFFDPGARTWNLFSNPSMVIVSKDGTVEEKVDGWGVPEDRIRFTNILRSYGNKLAGTTALPETTPTSTSTANTNTVTEKIYPVVKDEVFMSDLEKAVQYSIVKEIGMQPNLEEHTIKSLIRYTQALISFYPNMRVSMKNFLVPLRDWIKKNQHSKISSTQYNEKVRLLSKHHQPFSATPSNWTGCAGSQSKFRGYPCSLWTLFHTLSVNAADKDAALTKGGVSTVAKAMEGYINNFFSCRDCAEHFANHVSQLGSLPSTGDQSIIWLWRVHNEANLMLAGDPTEDPTRPKIQWPSEENCPMCRADGNSGTHLLNLDGEFWDQKQVLGYIKKVYKKENLINNSENDKGMEFFENNSDLGSDEDQKTSDLETEFERKTDNPDVSASVLRKHMNVLLMFCTLKLVKFV